MMNKTLKLALGINADALTLQEQINNNVDKEVQLKAINSLLRQSKELLEIVDSNSKK